MKRGPAKKKGAERREAPRDDEGARVPVCVIDRWKQGWLVCVMWLDKTKYQCECLYLVIERDTHVVTRPSLPLFLPPLPTHTTQRSNKLSFLPSAIKSPGHSTFPLLLHERGNSQHRGTGYVLVGCVCLCACGAGVRRQGGREGGREEWREGGLGLPARSKR
jgi:hypothetical protein